MPILSAQSAFSAPRMKTTRALFPGYKPSTPPPVTPLLTAPRPAAPRERETGGGPELSTDPANDESVGLNRSEEAVTQRSEQTVNAPTTRTLPPTVSR